VAVQRIYQSLDGQQFPSEVIEQRARDIFGALEEITRVGGRSLSDDAIDGLTALAKIDGMTGAKLRRLAKHSTDTDELETVLKTIKSIDALPTKPEGYAAVFKSLVHPWRNTSRGMMNVLRDIGSESFEGGIAKIERFEASTPILLPGATKPYGRRVDVKLLPPPEGGIRMEYKAWETGVPQWTKNGAERQFVADILNGAISPHGADAILNMRWVVRGTDVNLVKKEMLLVLGRGPDGEELAGAVMDKRVQEALDADVLDDDKLNRFINGILNGTIVREAR